MSTDKITYRLEIHLFIGKETEPIISFWETSAPCTNGMNPLLLKAESPFGDRLYMFSMKSYDEATRVALFHPYATHSKMQMHHDLLSFGFHRIESKVVEGAPTHEPRPSRRSA